MTLVLFTTLIWQLTRWWYIFPRYLLSPKYFISTAQIFSVVKTWSVKFMLELKWSVALGDRGEIPPELAEFLLAVCPLQSYNWIWGYGQAPVPLKQFTPDTREDNNCHFWLLTLLDQAKNIILVYYSSTIPIEGWRFVPPVASSRGDPALAAVHEAVGQGCCAPCVAAGDSEDSEEESPPLNWLYASCCRICNCQFTLEPVTIEASSQLSLTWLY